MTREKAAPPSPAQVLSATAIAALAGGGADLLEALRSELMVVMLENAQQAAESCASLCVSRIQEVQEEQRRRLEEELWWRNGAGNVSGVKIGSANAGTFGGNNIQRWSLTPSVSPCSSSPPTALSTPRMGKVVSHRSPPVIVEDAASGLIADRCTANEGGSGPSASLERTVSDRDRQSSRILNQSKLLMASMSEIMPTTPVRQISSRKLDKSVPSLTSQASPRQILRCFTSVREVLSKVDKEDEDSAIPRKPSRLSEILASPCTESVVPVKPIEPWKPLPPYPRKLLVAGAGPLPLVTYDPEHRHFTVEMARPGSGYQLLEEGIGPPPLIGLDARNNHYRVICERWWSTSPGIEPPSPPPKAESLAQEALAASGWPVDRCFLRDDNSVASPLTPRSPVHAEDRFSMTPRRPDDDSISFSAAPAQGDDQTVVLAGSYASVMAILKEQNAASPVVPRPSDGEPSVNHGTPPIVVEESRREVPTLATPTPKNRGSPTSANFTKLSASPSPPRTGPSPRDMEERAAELANQLRELAGHAAKLREASIIGTGHSAALSKRAAEGAGSLMNNQ